MCKSYRVAISIILLEFVFAFCTLIILHEEMTEAAEWEAGYFKAVNQGSATYGPRAECGP